MTNFHVPPRRTSGKTASKYGFYAHHFSEAELRMLDRGLDAQLADLEVMFQELFEHNEKSREAGQLSASEYLELQQALNNAQEALRKLRRTIKKETGGECEKM